MLAKATRAKRKRTAATQVVLRKGRVSEHHGHAGVSAAVCRRLAFVGVEIDERANAARESPQEIGATSSRCRVHVITAREDVIVARAVRSLAA